MLRDPSAVVSSRLGTPYVQERIAETSLRRGYFVESRMREIIRYSDDWSMIFEDIVPNWESDSRVRVLSYEKLTHNPEKEVRSLCNFLGETYEEVMLEGRKKGSVPMPAGKTPNQKLEKWRRKHHEKSMRPISTLDKWKKNLSAIEVSIIESRRIGGIKKTAILHPYPLLNVLKVTLSHIHFSQQKEVNFLPEKYTNQYAVD